MSEQPFTRVTGTLEQARREEASNIEAQVETLQERVAELEGCLRDTEAGHEILVAELRAENDELKKRDVEMNTALVALEKEVERLKSPEAIRARLCSCGRVDCNSDLC